MEDAAIQQIRAWREQAMGYQFMHTHAANLEYTMDYTLAIPAIILGCISGSTLLVHDHSLGIAAVACGLVATMLHGVRAFFEPGVKTQKHQHASSDFEQFVHHIEWTVTRGGAHDETRILDDIHQRYVTLLNNSIPIPQKSMNAFRRLLMAYPFDHPL